MRAETPRRSHADWSPQPDRPDPIEVLESQASTRLQELVPIRYGRMLVSPFTFYRGAAAVMAADLSSTPDSGIVVQACGDAHISNFGGFAAPDRRLVFGPNDFDETLPGVWEWDVKRMAASVEIAGRDVGLGPGSRRTLVTGCVRAYREGMIGFAAESHLDVWYDRLIGERARRSFWWTSRTQRANRVHGLVLPSTPEDEPAGGQQADREGRGNLRFRNVPPLLVPLRELLTEPHHPDESLYVREVLGEYERSLDEDRRYLFGTYRFVDMARKVVGVGSVGTRAWIFLLTGRDGQDPLVLQAKEAQRSVLEPYLGASRFENHGERVVRGQRISHAATDIFLSWQRSMGLDGLEHDFYVRQLWDWKASIDLSRMDGPGLLAYVRACGWSLARTHARSGTDWRSPPTSVQAAASTRRSPSFLRRTQIRTSWITGAWLTPSHRAA